jgi:hypothetical protein
MRESSCQFLRPYRACVIFAVLLYCSSMSLSQESNSLYTVSYLPSNTHGVVPQKGDYFDVWHTCLTTQGDQKTVPLLWNLELEGYKQGLTGNKAELPKWELTFKLSPRTIEIMDRAQKTGQIDFIKIRLDDINKRKAQMRKATFAMFVGSMFMH